MAPALSIASSVSSMTCAAFENGRCIAHGPLPDVAASLARRASLGVLHGVLVLDDATGQQIDLDLRGNEVQVRARYTPPAEPVSAPIETPPAAKPRGRPRMGVVAREVTLLPEHWSWLASQPGGASVVLRRLVHEARKAGEEQDRLRQVRERIYQAMRVLAGDRAGFEEASRALFAGDEGTFRAHIASWPEDVGSYLQHLGG
jgi:hypothetical protein